MTQKRTYLYFLIGALALPLVGCGSDSDDSDNSDNSGSAYTLQMLHFADVDGAPGALNEVDRFSALVSDFRGEYPDNTLIVSSGDNIIPGPRYFAAADDSLTEELGVPDAGRADMAFLNALGVHASAVGNHDLDAGTGAFASLIAAETGTSGTYPGTAFPHLSANLDFTTDSNLADLVTDDQQDVAAGAGKLAASAVVTLNGERIGLVGATTPALASITSTGDITISPAQVADLETNYDNLAAAIQPTVDRLRGAGINKIVLLAHMQQIAIEKALAQRLVGVDVIVAGGSNTLLADANDSLRAGDSIDDDYPLSFTSPAGEPVLVVNTEGDYRYLGRLVMTFDAAGVLDLDSLDSMANGAWASTAANVDLLMAETIGGVASVSQAVRDVLIARDGNLLGQTDVYLDGRRGKVRTEETNLGNLTADANLWYARLAEAGVAVSLKNGGGIRGAIGLIVQPPGSNDPADVEFLPTPANAEAGKNEGDISQFDLEGSLAFNNELSLLTVTAAELHEIMEYAVSATADGVTPGQFPQIGGIRFSFDPSLAARVGEDAIGDWTVFGERIRTLVIVDENGKTTDTLVRDGRVQGTSTREFRLVTLSFLASCVGSDLKAASADCGDGYPFKSLTHKVRQDLAAESDFAPAFDPQNASFTTTGSEQDALAEYLFNRFPVDGPLAFTEAEQTPLNDSRIQNLEQRNDDLVTP